MFKRTPSSSSPQEDPRRIPLFPKLYLANRSFLTYFIAAVLAQVCFGLVGCLPFVLFSLFRGNSRYFQHDAIMGLYAFTAGGTGGWIYYIFQDYLLYNYDIHTDEWNNRETEIYYGLVTLAQVIILGLIFAYILWRARGIMKKHIFIFLGIMILNVPFGVFILLSGIA